LARLLAFAFEKAASHMPVTTVHGVGISRHNAFNGFPETRYAFVAREAVTPGVEAFADLSTVGGSH